MTARAVRSGNEDLESEKPTEDARLGYKSPENTDVGIDECEEDAPGKRMSY